MTNLKGDVTHSNYFVGLINMQTTLDTSKLFPTLEGLQAIEVPQMIEQREFLCDGQLIEWQGDVTDVYSPIYYHDKGQWERIRLGSYPEMGAKDVSEVLIKAQKAYGLAGIVAHHAIR